MLNYCGNAGGAAARGRLQSCPGGAQGHRHGPPALPQFDTGMWHWATGTGSVSAPRACPSAGSHGEHPKTHLSPALRHPRARLCPCLACLKGATKENHSEAAPALQKQKGRGGVGAQGMAGCPQSPTGSRDRAQQSHGSPPASSSWAQHSTKKKPKGGCRDSWRSGKSGEAEKQTSKTPWGNAPRAICRVYP